MKRMLLIFSVIAGGLFAALLPVMDEQTIPTVPIDVIEAPPSASAVAYCGWLRSDAAIDTTVGFAGMQATQAEITVLQAGEIVAQGDRALAPFGGAPFSSLLPVGQAGAIIEFGSGPAAAATAGVGAVGLVATTCPVTLPDRWLVGGGSTADGTLLELRLFNPFPEDAKLTIRAVSENGSEPDQSLEAVTVAAQSSRVIALHEVLAFRDWLSVEVESTDGRIVPTLVEQSPTGETAVQSGVAAASVWYFPFTGVSELEDTLVLVNPSGTPAGYTVELATPTGPGEELDRDILDIRQVATIPIDSGAAGATVTVDAPVGVFLIGRGESGRAATSGSSLTSIEWLLPAAGLLPNTTVAFLNPGTTEVTATVITRQGQDKVIIPPGGVSQIVIGVSAGGAQVLANAPVVVGWYASTPDGVAYVMGVPVVRN